MKKLITIMLSVMMILTVVITNVSADNITPINPVKDNSYLIEIDQADAGSNGDSYEFSAYRIFKGTPSKFGNTKILSDIEWDDEAIDVDALKQDLITTFPGQFNSTMINSSAAEFASKMDAVARKELLSAVIARHVKAGGKTSISHLHEYTTSDASHSGWKIVADVNTPNKINWELSTIPQGTDTDGYVNLSDLGSSTTWDRGEHVGYKSYVQAGYYLIVNDKQPTDKAASRYILEIVDNLKISPKPMSTPTFSKQVATQNDSITAKLEPNKTENAISLKDLMTNYPNWAATADYDVGDDVLYRLSVSLPDDATLHTITNYRIEVYDYMSEGLTFQENTLLMYYGYSNNGEYHYTQVKPQQIVTKAVYEATKESVGNNITLNFIEEMETVYPQKYKLVESTHKYLDCKTEHEHQNTCWKDLEVETTKISTDMKKDYVESHVWYNVESNNTYANGTELTIGCDSINYMVNMIGAIPTGITGHFHIFYATTLNNNAKVGVDEINTNGNPNKAYLKFSQLNESFDGESPEYFTEVYTYKLNINKVDEAKQKLAGAEFELLKFYKQIKVDADTKYYASNQNRNHPTSTTPETVVDDETTLNEVWLVVDQDPTTTTSEFIYTGIDAGIYLLRETKAPTGYNKITSPVEFEVKATHTNDSADPKFESLTVTKLSGPIDFETGNGVVSASGELTATVVNKQGIKLPSTGGIGTTIFYTAGSALVIGAAVMLIVRRRKESD